MAIKGILNVMHNGLRTSHITYYFDHRSFEESSFNVVVKPRDKSSSVKHLRGGWIKVFWQWFLGMMRGYWLVFTAAGRDWCVRDLRCA